MGGRCSHVLKWKPSSNHFLVVHQNVEGRGHGPGDFHAFYKESRIYKWGSLKGFRTNPKSRRLVDVPGFEKMGVVTVVDRCEPYPTRVPLHFGGLSLSTLESAVQVTYMKTHPQ